jgi:pyridoxine kinase
MNILSIQSWVSYGHVGNASAVFPLQRLGANVWSINTVQFSNHTGYGHWTGQVYSGESVRELVDGIAARDVLQHCDAVLSGYMGDATIGAAILHAVERVRQANPAAVYCCDPVIGDTDTGVYVRPGIEELLREQALPQADIATPNRFEVERLTGIDCSTLERAKAAVTRLADGMRADGRRCVLMTSLETDTTPGDHLDMMVAEGGSFHLLRTPKLPVSVNGAGDAIAALFLFHRLRSGSAVTALEAAGSSVHGLLRRTHGKFSSLRHRTSLWRRARCSGLCRVEGVGLHEQCAGAKKAIRVAVAKLRSGISGDMQVQPTFSLLRARQFLRHPHLPQELLELPFQ